MARWVKTKRGTRRVTTPEERHVKVIRNGEVVASAQNLEVILRYQRTHSEIKSVSQRGKNLTVRYYNGAVCKVKFMDESILQRWIRNKRVRGSFP